MERGLELTSIKNISHWDVSNITNMANLLKNNSSLETYGEFGTWAAGLGTGKLVNISGLLYNNDKLTNDDLAYFGSWDVTGVTDMSYLLYDAVPSRRSSTSRTGARAACRPSTTPSPTWRSSPPSMAWRIGHRVVAALSHCSPWPTCSRTTSSSLT